MSDTSGGYTVIEIMVFLAVSMAILVAAQLVFQGQQGRTQFEQGMHNSASKFQQYVDRVGTSIFPGQGLYTCSISAVTGRSVIVAGSSGAGSNQACIFLGNAVQVVPGQSKIYFYAVLGNTYKALSGSAQGEPVTSFSQAMPEPAFASGADLTQEYDIPWATVKSSTVTTNLGATTDSHLVGFYNSLQDGYFGSGVAGAQAIIAKGYNFTSNSLSSVRSDAVKSCIEEQSASGVNCTSTPQITKWQVCFQSVGSNQTALLTTQSTPAGITTNVEYLDC